jgi:F-type H+-transporting ATPase subunit a
MQMFNYYTSPLEQFEILVIYPLSFFGLFDISITNSFIYMCIIFFCMFMFHFLGFYNINLVAGNALSSLLEFFYLFIFGMIRQQSGIVGQNYFPYFFFAFWFILLSNVFGLLPYGFTVTGHIIMTFFLAFSFNLSFFLYGISKHGLKFFMLFVPKGSPAPLIPLLIVIEVLSYLLRTLSLSIRLFANMMAGHTLMFILSSFMLSFLAIGFLGFFPMFAVFVLLFCIFALEVGIAFLQAYVFVILLSIYLKDGVEPVH